MSKISIKEVVISVFKKICAEKDFFRIEDVIFSLKEKTDFSDYMSDNSIRSLILNIIKDIIPDDMIEDNNGEFCRKDYRKSIPFDEYISKAALDHRLIPLSHSYKGGKNLDIFSEGQHITVYCRTIEDFKDAYNNYIDRYPYLRGDSGLKWNFMCYVNNNEDDYVWKYIIVDFPKVRQYAIDNKLIKC